MQQPIEHKDQAAHDLCLHLISGSVNVEQFEVMAQDSLVLQGVPNVTAHIIGGSHCVVVEHKGNQFAEVFACTPVEADNKLLSQPLPLFTGPVSLDLGWASYQFEHYYESVFSMGKPKLVSLEEDAIQLTKHPHYAGLVFDFPAGENGVVPKTVVVAQWIDNALSITTAHSYPSPGQERHHRLAIKMPVQGDIVFTKSTLTLMEGDVQ